MKSQQQVLSHILNVTLSCDVTHKNNCRSWYYHVVNFQLLAEIHLPRTALKWSATRLCLLRHKRTNQELALSIQIARGIQIFIFSCLSPPWCQKPSNLILYNHLKTEINLHFLPILLLRTQFASIRPRRFWVLYSEIMAAYFNNCIETVIHCLGKMQKF